VAVLCIAPADFPFRASPTSGGWRGAVLWFVGIGSFSSGFITWLINQGHRALLEVCQ